ncbi:unnamed protein product [Camellia sinensis]
MEDFIIDSLKKNLSCRFTSLPSSLLPVNSAQPTPVKWRVSEFMSVVMLPCSFKVLCMTLTERIFNLHTFSATTNTLGGMLLGRFFVGTGMGLSPPVAALYVSEVSPAFVRGTYGSFTQIATCLGLMGALFIGIPAKDIVGWWRVCFWVSAIPAAVLAVLMEFCAESPHWLFKRGRIAEAEIEFEKLLGGSHFKSAVSDLSKSDRGDEADAVKFSELFYGRHFKVVFIGSVGVPSDIANICVGIANLSDG